MKKRIKIFLTGGNGFLGRNIVEFLGDKYEILSPSIEDLNLIDPSLVYNFLKKNKVDVVIHAAAVGVSRNKQENLDIVSDNLKMFFNLIRSNNFYKRMIFIGSGAEYNKQQELRNIKENDFDNFVPEDQYGFYKYVCAKYCENVDFITHLRLFGVYGKYEDYKSRFVSNNICRALFGLSLSINKNCKFDYLFVDDFVKILENFIDNKPEEKFYNIGRGSSIDLESIARKIQEKINKSLDINIKETGFDNEYSCSIDRFNNEFGKFKYMDFDETLDKMIKYYRNFLPNIKKDSFLFDN